MWVSRRREHNQSSVVREVWDRAGETQGQQHICVTESPKAAGEHQEM